MTTENQATPEDQAAIEAAALAATAAPLNLGGAAPAEGLPAVTDEVKEKAGEVTAVTYNATGDVGLDMTLDFLGKLGYAPNNPAMAAAIEGDFSLLAAELASKDVKGYDRFIALGEKAYADQQAKNKTRQDEDRKAVESEAGGADSWAAIQKWATENADDTERKAVSEQLGKGGIQARMAVAWLRGAYEKSTGVADTDGPGKAVSTAKGAVGGNEPLTAREYGKAVMEARTGFKGDFESSTVYKTLQARRMAFKG